MAQILSIASGKGGVGKSMVTSNLGLLLAKRGFRVTLVDLDTGGADLHILFGMFHPTDTLTAFLDRRVKTIQEVVQPVPGYPNLSLIPGTGNTLVTANLPHAKKKRLINHLRKLDADFVVVDVGAGTSYHPLDFFLGADRYLTVTTPDPTAVLDLYRFIKLASIRKVLSAFLARDPVAEALLGKDFQSTQEVLAAVGQANAEGEAVAKDALEAFNPSLILNKMTRTTTVNTSQLQHMIRQYIQTDMDVLGRIPDDDAVERSIRQYLPVVEQAPQSPAAVALNDMVTNLLDWLQVEQPNSKS